MCEPTTLLMVGGLVLGAAGTAYQIDATNKAADAQEAQAAENAKVANAQAENATQAGYIEEDRQRQRTRQMLAAQRTAIAANNLDMSTGTPLELLGDTAVAGEQDALTIRANAAREAWGYKAQATDYRNQGSVAKTSAKNNATGSWLTYAGNATNSLYNYNRGK